MRESERESVFGERHVTGATFVIENFETKSWKCHSNFKTFFDVCKCHWLAKKTENALNSEKNAFGEYIAPISAVSMQMLLFFR